MEHEDERRIREKVQMYDQMPSALNKDRLWSSLILPGRPRPFSRITIYYAAASLLLATAIVIYGLELTHRKELELRLAEIELLLKSPAVSAQSAANSIAEELPCSEGVSTSFQERLTVQRRHRSKLTEASTEKTQLDESVPSTSTEAPLATNAEPADEVIAATDATELVNDEPVIIKASPQLTILGKSMPSATGTKHERLTFRLFNDEYNKGQAPAPPTPVVILAGINN